ncbi:ester hydrolase C11orf54-like [Lytechinus variegatus]|uniref:ester hydrolase C11orf54-like n=1 Tax=Lytechinus variegatus TaxID=7654 RepID=UPI001BB2842C|nr:ester hydrolase C11orf54-like [Lytechinus variegatus]
MAANTRLPVTRRALVVPELDELSRVLQEGLKICFETAEVNVVDCPDLTQQPFTLAAPGLCGNPRLADVGGVPYLVPLAQKEKKYNLDTVAEHVDLPGAFMLGAGAGPFDTVGTNSEMITNIRTKSAEQEGDNQTRISLIIPEDGSFCLKKSPCRDFQLLGNFLATEGKPGKVLEVKCQARRGPDNFVSVMRFILHKHYGKDKFLGLGGVFLIEEGKAKIHIMPDFSRTPLNSEEDVNKWLKFFEFNAPLICCSVFVSHDPGMDLRIEHTHCFSHHGQGGHYHYDVTPKTVSYRGYFVPAEWMYRIDPPQQTHNIGRD